MPITELPMIFKIL